MAKFQIGIINVTGYAGVELARILHSHPQARVAWVTGRGSAGQKLTQVFPHLIGMDLPIVAEPPGGADLVFSALPHKASAEALIPQLDNNIKVVDISADFRLKNPSLYPEWYGFKHPAPDWLAKAVYGLPELNRSLIAGAQLVANPGCYPTSAILALAPAMKEGLIEADVIVDSKSGISGAGRTLALNVHHSEANENLSAYALDGHRHLPEISQELQAVRPAAPLSVTFLPHLIPMTRGILSTCYARLTARLPAGNAGKQQLLELYCDFYKDEPFTRVVASPPQTKYTSGSNLCLIHPTMDLRTGRLIVISVLDNLVKGAAGQAIQNMNLMLGLPETTGLEALALYP
ncbi:MAG: N-acetyl-gamma-glutamyl-phosphate reductase [Chloroflexi bacterium]|nr:N-acetyl-gamma-glutamyl-phosphate reductase [Chloroflexota bacterium]